MGTVACSRDSPLSRLTFHASAHWDALALRMPHKKGPRCQSSLCPHWLDISYPRFPPLRAATSTSSDGQEPFHLSRLPTTPADSVCLGFKLSNNKGRVLKLHSLWFLIKQPESRVKGMPKTRVQMKSRHPQMPSPFLMNMSSNIKSNTSSRE